MDRAGTNALAGQPSAYLRQHAEQPVHWQPFDDAAFAAAASREQPVFLSVGYAACHWCHVMAHESFDDPELAEYLNANFIPVKVDREERPDVDAVYLAATQAISGEGGWPMTVFLTPQGQAFHAGTYFPPRPIDGRPSLRQVLAAVLEAWQERRAEVYESAARLAEALQGQPLSLSAVKLDLAPDARAELLAAAVARLAEQEDPENGGFGNAPKFPPSPVLGFLIRHAAVPSETAGQGRAMAARALAAMADSALYDQLAGGFARYSVTADWSLPHYEKMLYDNAQLLRHYAAWLKLAEDSDFSGSRASKVVRGVVDFLLTSLLLPTGCFASSLDADSLTNDSLTNDSLVKNSLANSVLTEGAAYTWTSAELTAVLGEADGVRYAALMQVGSTPTPLHPGRAFDAGEQAFVDRLRPALLDSRNRRNQPALDDKAVAGWNGLAISGLLEAWSVLDDPRCLAVAEQCGRALLASHWRGGRLYRVPGAASIGLLEDYAWCAEAFFLLFSATADPSWYLSGEELLLAACQTFVQDGELIDAVPESAELLRAQGGRQGAEPLDNATPSGVAAFAETLIRYAALSGSVPHRDLADAILAGLADLAVRHPRAAGAALAATESALAGPLEVAVVGVAKTKLLQVAKRSPSPGLVIAASTDENDGDAMSPVPLLQGRSASEGALAFLCRGMVCQRPTDDPNQLQAELSGHKPRTQWQ